MRERERLKSEKALQEGKPLGPIVSDTPLSERLVPNSGYGVRKDGKIECAPTIRDEVIKIEAKLTAAQEERDILRDYISANEDAERKAIDAAKGGGMSDTQSSHAAWLRLVGADIRIEGYNGLANTCELCADHMDELESKLIELRSDLLIQVSELAAAQKTIAELKSENTKTHFRNLRESKEDIAKWYTDRIDTAKKKG